MCFSVQFTGQGVSIQQRKGCATNYVQSHLIEFRFKWCDPCQQWPQAHELTKLSCQYIVQSDSDYEIGVDCWGLISFGHICKIFILVNCPMEPLVKSPIGKFTIMVNLLIGESAGYSNLPVAVWQLCTPFSIFWHNGLPFCWYEINAGCQGMVASTVHSV